MNNLKVGPRLALLVAIFSVFLVAIGLLGLTGTAHTLTGLKTVYEDRTVPGVLLGRIHRLMNANFSEILRAFQHNPAIEISKLHDHPVQEHLKRMENNLKAIDETWAIYMATRHTDEEKQLAASYEAKYRAYIAELVRPTMEALAGGDYSLDTTSRFLKGNRAKGGEVDKLAEQLIDLQAKVAKSEYERSLAEYERNRILSIAAIVLGLLLGGGMAWWIIHSVTEPLGAIRDAVARVQSSGDFTLTIPHRGNDEAGETAQAFNDLLASLRTTMGQLLQTVGDVDRAVSDMAENARQSAGASADTSEAAASMAASVEEMTVSISHVADNTRDAIGIAGKAGELSNDGGVIIEKAVAEITQIAGTVRQVSEQIAALGQHSERITGVVQVIKDVADQTNLLALNAAIEAARAGEAGRGFAVVADEVRKLAERTTGATGEIAAMIAEVQASSRSAVSAMEQAVSQVDSGVSLASQAGSAIVEIRSSTADVVRVVSDISSAIAEQGSASQSIAAQVERVAQAAEENSASAQHSADAAANMEIHTRAMREAAGRFRI
ncbi:MAG: methyl-accepting chemotaxis protein [Sterolibacteriaceae bacterium MAG5]|nr:methyl-accepting chemotaxis protein [Candidatus Nitricoxidireducens bremensis]